MLVAYPWPGNIRQLKNLVEQLSVIETVREINAILLDSYLPKLADKSPVRINESVNETFSEREIMYKFLFEMKKDLTELKKLVVELISQGENIHLNNDQTAVVNRIYSDLIEHINTGSRTLPLGRPDLPAANKNSSEVFETHEVFEESLSLEDREKELIQKALEKHRGKRKYAASELGISERTLYRKIKEYNLAE